MSTETVIVVKPRINEEYFYIDSTFEGVLSISSSKWVNNYKDIERYKNKNIFLLYEYVHTIFEDIKNLLLESKQISI